MLTIASSMSGGQFWSTLRSEANAISWNLRDAIRNGSAKELHPSLTRAMQSAERINSLITERSDGFKQNLVHRRDAESK